MPSPKRSSAVQRRTGAAPFNIGELVMANSKAPGDYRGRRGHITEVSADKAECRVEFEDGLLPTTGYLPAKWLDR
jgi:hypothetical protein